MEADIVAHSGLSARGSFVQTQTGFHGRIAFDATAPDGTPRKLVDVSRLRSMGWEARSTLRDGLTETYDWCRSGPGNRSAETPLPARGRHAVSFPRA